MNEGVGKNLLESKDFNNTGVKFYWSTDKKNHPVIIRSELDSRDCTHVEVSDYVLLRNTDGTYQIKRRTDRKCLKRTV